MEESVTQNMDQEILQGMQNPVADARMGEINEAATNPTKSTIESESVKTGVADGVRKLEQETKETFEDKEDTATTSMVSNTKKLEEKEPVKKQKTVLGMRPLTFGLVTVTALIGGYLLYQKYKK